MLNCAKNALTKQNLILNYTVASRNQSLNALKIKYTHLRLITAYAPRINLILITTSVNNVSLHIFGIQKPVNVNYAKKECIIQTKVNHVLIAKVI